MLKATHLNRGRGIHVFRDLKQLKHLIQTYCQGKDDNEAENSPKKKGFKFNSFVI
jgi:hypothetical protein